MSDPLRTSPAADDLCTEAELEATDLLLRSLAASLAAPADASATLAADADPALGLLRALATSLEPAPALDLTRIHAEAARRSADSPALAPLQPRPAHSWARRAGGVLAGLSLLLPLGSAAYAADPGSPLYPVRVAVFGLAPSDHEGRVREALARTEAPPRVQAAPAPVEVEAVGASEASRAATALAALREGLTRPAAPAAGSDASRTARTAAPVTDSPARGERAAKPQKPARGEKAAKPQKPARGEKAAKPQKAAKPRKDARATRAASTSRPEGSLQRDRASADRARRGR